MNIHTINSTSVLSRCKRFIGAMLAVALMIPAVAFSQLTVDLGTASSFAVLAAAGITNTGDTFLTGDIGSYPTASITGFPPGDFTGTNHGNDDVTKQAMTDLNAAYLDAAGRTGASTIPSDLNTQILNPGVYKSDDGTFLNTGTLTLMGSASDVFIFQMATTLITDASSTVILWGGVQWTNIFWQVGSSATLGANSLLEGTILANTTITAGEGADIHGRLLAGAVTSSGAVTLINNTALPVELTSFTATLNNSMVKLNWNTATEVSNYGFEVERSADKINWSKIAFVNGHGNSNSPKQYSYTDSKISSGKYYYRLKQIDTDGAFAYSKEIEVSTGELLKDFMVEQNFPNPFNPTTTIKFGFKEPVSAKLIIYNALGSEVVTLFNERAEAGKIYSIEFDGTGIASGIYYYAISGGNYNSVKKMILMK